MRKAEERAETLEGYLIALANLDEFIRIVRGSASRDEARVKLLAFEFTKRQVEQIGILIRSEARLTNGRYAFSEQQADEILNLRLYQLTGLEREKINKNTRNFSNRSKIFATFWPKSNASSRSSKKNSARFAINTARRA